MKNKTGNIIILIISCISFIISGNLFYNMGIFVDEYNTNPAAIYGGDFWLYMAWLQPLLLIVIIILTILSLRKR